MGLSWRRTFFKRLGVPYQQFYFALGLDLASLIRLSDAGRGVWIHKPGAQEVSDCRYKSGSHHIILEFKSRGIDGLS